MPVQTTRSGRVVKNSSSKQSKLDALELLERQRRGEKIDIGIKEDEPLFDEVDEEEYKSSRKGGFVVDRDSDDEYDSDDLEFIDDGFGDDGDDDLRARKGGTSKRERKRTKDLADTDPKQRSMKSFLGASTSKATLSSMSIDRSKKVEVDQEAILSQMLFDVPVTRSLSAKKPPPPPRIPCPTQKSSLASHSSFSISTASQSSSQSIKPARKHEVEDIPVKKQRVSSPQPSVELTLDDFTDDLPSTIYEQMATQESIIPEDEQSNSGIEAAPLDDDTKSNLEFFRDEEGRQYTKFYWYDCCEGPSPGTVCFFGRINAITVNKFVSCCVIIKNIKRTSYLLIAPDSTYEQAVGEFTHITAKRHGIKSFTCEKVTKKYAFSSDSDVPLITDYVKVEFPVNQANLPVDLKGETFTKVLNVNQSPMEKLILDLKLRGPCWMRIIEPVASTAPITWTRIELVIDSPKNLIVDVDSATTKAPYFCVLSLALQTHAHPTAPGRNDILAISVMVNTAFNLDECLTRTNKASGHFMLMTKPPVSQKETLRLPYDFQNAIKTYRTTRFELVNSERDLLTNFMDKFNSLDPDIVVGHDLLNFDFETLIKQMAVNKVGIWHKLGRFKRTTLPSSKKAFPYLFTGRVLCDIKKSAEELMQLRSYDLTELTTKLLDRKRVEYNHASLVEAFKTSNGIITMLDATWQDVDSIFSIMAELNIIPLALKITNITGNILSRTLAAGRSERNEYLLLHAFHEDNFICPEKTLAWEKKNAKIASRGFENNDNENGGENQASLQSGRRKAAYTGGLVLEPKAGFYETCILLMDFNSLYPSIIQEFNICFSTVKAPATNGDENVTNVPSESAPNGILPTQLKNLVDRRRQVKRLMADCKQPMQKTLLDIEQRALKLTANSMYGCLGFEHSRFYAKHLASLVTSKGREILMSTKAMVENLGYEVIYGDTDSLMIDTKITDYQEVIQRGTAIKSSINQTFKLLEIDIDGVYRPLLLLKKKNYAGASLSMLPDGKLMKKIETKGLDSVRRDRAVIAKEASEHILSMIMDSEKDVCQIVQDIHAYLKELSDIINRDELDVRKYLISKQLNKNPDEYRDTKGIGHVSIALRHNADPKQVKKMRSGDVIEYVVCLDGTTESANQRCYTLAEMSANETLKIDKDFYLCQQIYTAITRICDKLPFTNAYVIAEAMGIESSSSIKIPRETNTSSEMKDQLVSKGAARFAMCEALKIRCPSCTFIEEVRERTRKQAASKGGSCELSLTACSNCNARFASNSRQVVVQVIEMIKRLTLSLYNARFKCTECEHTTRNVFGPLSERELPVCVKCSAEMVSEMDDRQMDLQLSYYKYLLDAREEEQSVPDDILDMYANCHQEVLGALRMSYINTIDAQTVFSMVCSSH